MCAIALVAAVVAVDKLTGQSCPCTNVDCAQACTGVQPCESSSSVSGGLSFWHVRCHMFSYSVLASRLMSGLASLLWSLLSVVFLFSLLLLLWWWWCSCSCTFCHCCVQLTCCCFFMTVIVPNSNGKESDINDCYTS